MNLVVVVLSFEALEECTSVLVSDGADHRLVRAATGVIAEGGISTRETWMLVRLGRQAVSAIASLTAAPKSNVVKRATIALSARKIQTEVVHPLSMNRGGTMVAVAMTMVKTAMSISMSLQRVLVMLSGLLRTRTRTRGTRGRERMETASMKISTMVRKYIILAFTHNRVPS